MEHENTENTQNWEKRKTFFDSFNESMAIKQKMRLKSKLMFYRFMSTMVDSGMSLIKSVEVIRWQEKNKTVQIMLEDVIANLRAWQTLSASLWKYYNTFWSSEVAILESGEKTWKLNSVLKDLANQIEKVSSISWKIKAALIYPVAVILIAFAVVVVMMVFVVPKLLELFTDANDLPAVTRALIATSDFFINSWYLIIIGFFLIVVFTKAWWKTKEWRYYLDYIMLKLPIFWWLTKKVILSKFARILSGLLWSWVSVVESLKIVSEALWNEVYRQRIMLLQMDIKKWIKIWESLDGDKLFPPMLVQMVQIWEQTAKLDSTIVKIADFYDEEVDNVVSIINKLLEPIIIVFIAMVVLFIALWVMQPIMSLTEQIQ